MEDSRGVSRRQIAVTLSVVGAIIGLVVLGLWLSDPARKLERAAREPETVKRYRTPGSGVDPSDVWITRSEAELRGLQKGNQDLQRQVTELQKRLQALQERERHTARRPPASALLPAPPALARHGPASAHDTAAPFAEAATELPPTVEPEGAGARMLPIPPPPPGARRTGAPSARAGAPMAHHGILVVDLERDTASQRKPTTQGGQREATPQRHIQHYLPAGTFARAVLLSGLDAPTGGVANTNPHPVLLRLAEHGTLPNRFRSRVKECFVTAAGYGDISSERAYLRLERLSCVLHGGDVVETVLKGYVSGEDGKTGVRGRLVSKQGQIIAKTLLVGIAGGIGRGLAQSMTTTSTSALGAVQTVNPEDLFKYGLSQGSATALDKVADWYLQRANETYPIIEVDAGRTVDVVLTEGAELGVDLFEETGRRNRT